MPLLINLPYFILTHTFGHSMFCSVLFFNLNKIIMLWVGFGFVWHNLHPTRVCLLLHSENWISFSHYSQNVYFLYFSLSLACIFKLWDSNSIFVICSSCCFEKLPVYASRWIFMSKSASLLQNSRGLRIKCVLFASVFKLVGLFIYLRSSSLNAFRFKDYFKIFSLVVYDCWPSPPTKILVYL